jgi:hypothetical protein
LGLARNPEMESLQRAQQQPRFKGSHRGSQVHSVVDEL